MAQLPNAKLNALKVNKEQWGIGAEGGAAAVSSLQPPQHMQHPHQHRNSSHTLKCQEECNCSATATHKCLHPCMHSCVFLSVSVSVQAPAPKAAAKKAAAPAEGGVGAAKGFTGVPSEYGRPVINMPTGFPASSDAQTVSCTPLSASPKFCPFFFE